MSSNRRACTRTDRTRSGLLDRPSLTQGIYHHFHSLWAFRCCVLDENIVFIGAVWEMVGVQEGPIQKCVLNWVQHWVCSKYFVAFTMSEDSMICLAIMFDNVVLQGLRHRAQVYNFSC